MNTAHLITNARLADPARDDEIGAGWLYMHEGRIAALGAGDPPADVQGRDGVTPWDAAGAVLAPGLVDMGARLDVSGAAGDDRAALAEAAAAGGVTTVLLSPDSAPRPQSPERLSALCASLSAPGATGEAHLIPVAALSADERLSELGLMHAAGARLAGAGTRPVAHAALMRAALRTAASHGLPVLTPARHGELEAGGVAHEGAVGARLGLAGLPPLAEAVAIARDAALARDADATLVVTGVSSRDGLTALADAKARSRETGRGRIFGAACVHSLVFNDVDLGDLDARFHLIPPVREEADRLALLDAVRGGLIDMISSQHDAVPLHEKQHPFPEAVPGAPGLETLLSALLGLVSDEQLSLPEALRLASMGPAVALGLEAGRLEAGAPADLVLFDPHAPWKCRAAEFASTGRVTPFEGRLMNGRVRATFVGGVVAFHAAMAA